MKYRLKLYHNRWYLEEHRFHKYGKFKVWTILGELEQTFNYHTSNGKGKHYWIRYSGNKTLLNRATKWGLDCRVSEKGYVKYHHNVDIRECLHLIKESSPDLNNFLEQLFA